MGDPHGDEIHKKMEHKQQGRLGKIQPSSEKIDLEKLNNYNKIERELKNIMEKTIGSTTVTTGKKRKNKASDEIKKLRIERKNKRKEFQEAIIKNENKTEKRPAI